MSFEDPLASGDLDGFAAVSRGSEALDRFNSQAALINGFTDSDDPTAMINSMVGGSGLVGCLSELATGLVTAQYVGGYGDSSFGSYLIDLLTSPINEFGSLVRALFIPDATTSPDDFEYWSAVNLKTLSASFLNPMTSIWMGQFNVLSASLDEFVRGAFWDTSTDQTGNRSLVQQTTDRVNLAFHQLFTDGEKIVANIGGMLLFALVEGIPAIEAELSYLSRMRGTMKKLLDQTCKLPPSMMPGLPNAIISEHLCIALAELESVRYDLAKKNVLDVGRFNTATSHVCLAKESIFDPSKGLKGNVTTQFKNLFALNDLQFNTLRDFAGGKLGALMPDPNFRLQTILLQRYNGMLQATDPQLLKFHENMQEFNATLDGFSSIYLGDVFSRIVELLRRQIQMVKHQLDADAAGFSVANDINNIDELRGFGAERAQWDYANNWGPGTGSAGLPKTKPYDRTYQEARSNQQQKGVPNAGAEEMDDAFNRSRNWKPADAKNPDYNAKVSGLDQTPRVQEQTGRKAVSTDVQAQGSDIYSYLSTQANSYVVLTSLCFVMERMTKLYKGVQSILSANDKVMNSIKKFVYSYGANVCGDPYGADDINANVRNFMQVAEMRLGGRVRTNHPIQEAYKGVIRSLDKHELFLRCMQREINNFLKYLQLSTQLIAAFMNTIAISRSVYQLYRSFASLDLLGFFKFRWTLDRANILDVILKALQCLVLQCNNPFVSSLARMATARFTSQKSAERAKAVTMASMDEGPAVAQKMGNNNRLQSFFRLIQSIQRLTSMNIEDLCAIQSKATNTANSSVRAASDNFTKVTAAAPGSTGIDTREAQRKQETLQRSQVGKGQVPFSALGS